MTKAPSENFESIRLPECLTFTQLKNVVRRVTWVHTADIKLLDLVKTVTVYLGNMSITMTGETTGEVCEFWTLQNSVKTRTKCHGNINFVNLLELNVCESRINDNHLVGVLRICKTLPILNGSGCTGITDFGFKKAFLNYMLFSSTFPIVHFYM